MAEEPQESVLPTSLMFSVFARFIEGDDNVELYDNLRIPYKYMDAVDDLWERLEKDREANPLKPGESYEIPNEFYL
jgi:hypothetical protein